MYTRPSNAHSLWFAAALLPGGWANDVRIDVNAGRIVAVHVGVHALPNDERHAIGIPALGNVHSHAFQRALAGLTERREGADTFWSWREAMYALVARITPDQLEAIAALAFMEMLERGIGRVAEFHYVHHAEDGSHYDDIGELASRIAAATSSSGIGLTLLPVFYAHGGIGGQPPKPTQQRFVNSLDSFARLFDAAKRAVSHLDDATVGIAAHSIRAVTPDELRVLVDMESNAPMHMHIAEQIGEVEEWQRFTGARPMEWLLDRFDVNARWCLVHATHLSPNELARVAASGATVGLCPITEANLGDGLFPAKELVALNGRFGIGTDSNVLIDIAEELRLLEYGQRLQHRERNTLSVNDDRSSGRVLFDHASVGGSHACGARSGQLAAGCVADIVALSKEHPSMIGRSGDTLLDSWIFAGARVVDCVWSAGRKVVAQGRHHDRDRIERAYVEAMRVLRR